MNLASDDIHVAGLLKGAGAKGEMPEMGGGFRKCWFGTPTGPVDVPCEDVMEIDPLAPKPAKQGRPVVKP